MYCPEYDTVFFTLVVFNDPPLSIRWVPEILFYSDVKLLLRDVVLYVFDR